MKKFFIYPVFVFLFLCFIGMIGFGAIVKYHYDGGKNYNNLRETVIFLSSIPHRIRLMFYTGNINLDKPPYLKKHIKKERLKKFLPINRNAILVLSRYDHNQNKGIVEIVDLKNFETIHAYNLDVTKFHKMIDSKKKIKNLERDNSKIRFRYVHPLILNDGSLVSNSGDTPLFKIDICSKIQWIDYTMGHHHSKNLDHEGNIISIAYLKPLSKTVQKFNLKNFAENAIIKTNPEGKIIYKKSIIEIMIDNKILPENYPITSYKQKILNPVYVNDIEPVLTDGKYWKKGDMFISIRNLSSILHYRPKTNKVINYIIGPFLQQHDVDVISDKEISIFNNNNFFINNEYSNIVVYNLETKKFKKIYDKQLKDNNFKTDTNGLSQILVDGSLMVEETVHGRIILFNKNGQKEWEYVNKDIDGNIGRVFWSRIIEDKLFIKRYKSLIKNKKCLN